MWSLMNAISFGVIPLLDWKESPMVQFMTPKDIAFINDHIDYLMKQRIQVDLTEVKEEGQRVEKEEKKKNAKEEKGKGKEKADIQFSKKVVSLEVIEKCLSFLGELDLEPHLGGKQKTQTIFNHFQ